MADTLPPVWMGARIKPEQTGAVLSFCNFILYLFYILFVFQAQVSGHWRPLRKSRFTPRKGAGYPGFLGFADRRLSLRQVDWVLIPVDQSSGGVGWRGAAWWAAAPRTATSSCCAAALELKIWRPPVLNWSHELFLVELHRYSIVCEEEWCRISSLIHTEPFLVWNPFSALLSFFSLVLYFRDPCSCIGQLLSSADTNYFFRKNADHTNRTYRLRNLVDVILECLQHTDWRMVVKIDYCCQRGDLHPAAGCECVGRVSLYSSVGDDHCTVGCSTQCTVRWSGPTLKRWQLALTCVGTATTRNHQEFDYVYSLVLKGLLISLAAASKYVIEITPPAH